MITGSKHQEDMTNLNVYVPNNRVSKYIKQKLLELKRVDKAKIVGGISTPFFQHFGCLPVDFRKSKRI